MIERDRSTLEEPIQFAEIMDAIKLLKVNKTPCNDRLMGEFCEKFKDQLVKPFENVFFGMLS